MTEKGNYLAMIRKPKAIIQSIERELKTLNFEENDLICVTLEKIEGSPTSYIIRKMKEIEIQPSVLKKLPMGRFLGVKKTEDMEGNERIAILWLCNGLGSPSGLSSKKYFDINTGEYISEAR